MEDRRRTLFIFIQQNSVLLDDFSILGLEPRLQNLLYTRVLVIGFGRGNKFKTSEPRQLRNSFDRSENVGTTEGDVLDARAIVVLQKFGDLRFFFAGRGLVDGDEDRRGVIREHLAVEGGPLGLNVLQKLGRRERRGR